MIKIFYNNEKLCQIINEEIETSNDFKKDAAALVAWIREILEEVKIAIVIEWIDRYSKRFPTFEANPAPHLIRRYH